MAVTVSLNGVNKTIYISIRYVLLSVDTTCCYKVTI